MKLTKEQILGIVRHALTFIGGIVVMKGLTDEATIPPINVKACLTIPKICSFVNFIILILN